MRFNALGCILAALFVSLILIGCPPINFQMTPNPTLTSAQPESSLKTLENENETPVAITLPVPTPPSLPVRLDVRTACDYCTFFSSNRWQPNLGYATVVTDTSAFYNIYVEKYGVSVNQVIAFMDAKPNDKWPPDSATPGLVDPLSIPSCFGNGYTIEMGVTNLATDEWIRVENQPLWQVLSFEDSTDSVHYYVWGLEGGGTFRMYETELRHSSFDNQIHLASASNPANIPDFFTLQPGEQEWFRVNVMCMEPGIYTLQVAIKYFYHGNEQLVWSDKLVTIFSPEQYYYWMVESQSWKDNTAVPFAYLLGLFAWNANTKTWDMISKPSVELWMNKR